MHSAFDPMEHGAFGELSTLFRESCVRYMMKVSALAGGKGMSRDEAHAFVAPRRLLVWASVHSDGSAHPWHTHRDAVLSGVYFLNGESSQGGGQFVA